MTAFARFASCWRPNGTRIVALKIMVNHHRRSCENLGAMEKQQEGMKKVLEQHQKSCNGSRTSQGLGLGEKETFWLQTLSKRQERKLLTWNTAGRQKFISRAGEFSQEVNILALLHRRICSVSSACLYTT